MKFVLVMLALVFGAWLWRRGRSTEPAESTPPNPAPPPDHTSVQEMVACAHCGLHLPAADAIRSPAGWYCSKDHLNRPTHPHAGDL